MAPLRRYLRITQFSVLEVRVYLHKPSDAAWLLSSRDNVLQRIISAAKPYVLPKLREENENAKGRKGGKKRKGVKDVAESGEHMPDEDADINYSAEDFEVSIFLKQASTRHSLLTKRKRFQNKPRLKSTGNKLTGWLNNKENPIHVEEEAPALLIEDDENEVPLNDVPEAAADTAGRKAAAKAGAPAADDEPLFVSSSDDEFFHTQRAQRTRGAKRRKRQHAPEDEAAHVEEEVAVAPTDDDDDDNDDKKKLALDTSYDGFSIYGRVLCLIVKRKGGGGGGSGRKDASAADAQAAGGSQMMEQWVSTQANGDAWLDDDAPEG